MARVEVTMEKALRVAMEFDATEEELEMLHDGINPFQDEMEEELCNGDVEYDFAAVNQDAGITIKEWD